MTPRYACLTVGLPLLLLVTAIPGRAGWVGGPSDRDAVALERGRGGWVVDATLNGRVRGRFLLDSGATWCALSEETAARLRLTQTDRRIPVETAGGTIQAPFVRLGSVDVGGHKARDLQAVVLDAIGEDFDGIIGLNFLNEFTYAIDPRRAILRLE
jgi:clan AA aspartic protease (TIGR02281 family)